MTDLFREVEEDVRREHYAKLWQKYGAIIVAFAVVVLMSVGGYVLWTRYQKSVAEDASATYATALDLAQAGQIDEALANLSTLAGSAKGYSELARFQEAALLIQKGDIAAALLKYDEIVARSEDPMFRDLARLKSAMLQADTLSPDALKERVAPLLTPAGTFHASAAELSAYADYRAGRIEMARAAFEVLVSDPTTPQGIRERADKFLAVLPAVPATTPAPAPAPAPVAPAEGSDAPPPPAATP